MAGLQAFREAYVSAGSLPEFSDDFMDYDSRRLRYEIYWAFYESSVYNDVHDWATAYRRTQGLYKYIRNIYNPAFRLGEFWKAHLWGGLLDPAAGDGKEFPSALPIVIDDENAQADELRAAIGQVWEWSRWQVIKDLVTLRGSILGDVGIRVMDDVDRGKVYLQPVHPGTIEDIDLDPFGNVKGYTLQEVREDPEKAGKDVTYTETAERDGDLVIYRTYRDNKPYAWNGTAEEWEEPYGFIPMVMIQHNNVGLDWGWSELQPARSKIHEVDDLASNLSDQIRKTVNPVWLFSGLNKPSSAPDVTGADSSTSRPQPGREEMNALYTTNPDAKALPLVAPLDIAGVVQHIQEVLQQLEGDYPELEYLKRRKELGNISGRALRTIQQDPVVKVQQRRAGYDDAIRRAQQMAVAIGGFREYDGFAGFGLDSYAAGDLDHQIGKRPVFDVDPMDEIEQEEAFWKVAESAARAGVPLPVYLQFQGWSEERIAALVESEEYQAQQEASRLMLGVNLG